MTNQSDALASWLFQRLDVPSHPSIDLEALATRMGVDRVCETEMAEDGRLEPYGWSAPSLDQYYKALDAVAGAADDTETHLYERLCDLTNLDLRLVCYDVGSTYFEWLALANRSQRQRCTIVTADTIGVVASSTEGFHVFDALISAFFGPVAGACPPEPQRDLNPITINWGLLRRCYNLHFGLVPYLHPAEEPLSQHTSQPYESGLDTDRTVEVTAVKSHSRARHWPSSSIWIQNSLKSSQHVRAARPRLPNQSHMATWFD